MRAAMQLKIGVACSTLNDVRESMHLAVNLLDNCRKGHLTNLLPKNIKFTSESL
jgi:hypothetical protein